ncbi:cysteine--tRNA ligase [Pseudohalocynthiibacter sp. F2068]|jgi:cysteinyl-tRNA synthetase|uniref:cysteine--tRNA ligase n=1 Tax=Pseudohalocynthiibacter sp. F2068 TaxID=2926418 RepID=UPI001FF19567|nr:cysteine--tRNA ligase [Pseudohalocynthiibacter sp. F2068]MCK0100977.1 cysteine--tRNA ligase [Pseudohalocynthiibacter sp. F2068]
MTKITLHNTKTRKKEVFTPIDEENVRMYVCGPTVYDRAHIGNARPVVVFDVLYRLLRHVYGEDHVTYVRNFTDVDDKINARAIENVGKDGDVNAEIARITDMTTQWFLDDMGALGALEPNAMPRATQYIPQMVAMIQTLIEKRFAYVVRSESNNPPEEYVLADREALLGEHALFEVEKYERYGQLSGQSTEDMIAGARGEKAPGKRSPMDFVLWKPSTPDLPGWDSPWGRGRPGWHIECSAMSKALLGDRFDIHGGGRDLMFPHHENEIAQSCCANGTDEMAQVWMHNEMLQVEGKKMSKSLGNFFTVRDLLDQGVPGEVIRFVFLSTHYRKPMDWTEQKRREASRELDSWVTSLSVDHELLDNPIDLGQCDQQIVAALADDLNTSFAITKLKATAKFIDNSREFLHLSEPRQLEVRRIFVASAFLLGFDLVELAKQMRNRPAAKDLEYYTLSMVYERSQAMETKDFTEVDRLKAALLNAGVEVRMTKDDVELVPGPDFDPSKLEALK